MKYLLDTHTAVWVFENRLKLSKPALKILNDVSNPLCVSILSAWERRNKDYTALTKIGDDHAVPPSVCTAFTT